MMAYDVGTGPVSFSNWEAVPNAPPANLSGTTSNGAKKMSLGHYPVFGSVASSSILLNGLFFVAEGALLYSLIKPNEKKDRKKQVLLLLPVVSIHFAMNQAMN